MANLQIKGVDEALYAQIKQVAASENRSVSQQILFVVSRYLANRKQFHKAKTGAQVLMELSGSWEDDRSAKQIVSGIRRDRRNSSKLRRGLDVPA